MARFTVVTRGIQEYNGASAAAAEVNAASALDKQVPRWNGPAERMLWKYPQRTDPRDYGAKFDLLTGNYARVNTGDNFFTNRWAADQGLGAPLFSSADLYKLVAIAGCGTNRNTLIGLIIDYHQGDGTSGNPDKIYLGDLNRNPITASFGNGTLRQVWWATDDTVALQAAINGTAAGILECPAGNCAISDTIDFNGISFAGTGKGRAFYFYGVGSGRDSVGNAATKFYNFGANEAFLSSKPNVLALHGGRFGIRNLQDIGRSTFTGEASLDTGTIFLANQYGSGHWEDMYLLGTGNYNSKLTGTTAIGSDTITGILVPVLTAFGQLTAPKVGDWIFGAGIPANTTITEIHESTGIVKMSQNATAAATITWQWQTSGAGHGLWIDNGSTGEQQFVRIDVNHYDAMPSGNFAGSDGIRFGSMIYTDVHSTANTNATTTLSNISAFTGWQPGATVQLNTRVNGAGQTVDTTSRTLTVTSTAGLPASGTAVIDGVAVSATYTVASPTTLTVSVASGSYTATNNGYVTVAQATWSALVLRVRRDLGTALLNTATPGTATGIGLSFSTAGENAGNMQFDTCNVNGCQNGVHGYEGSLVNSCSFNALKVTAAGALPTGSAPRKNVGVWIEYNQAAHVFNAPHSESNYYGYYFNGCDTVTLVAPLVGSRQGTAGDGSRGFYFTNFPAIAASHAKGNRVICGRMGGGYDYGVEFANADDNEVSIYWPTTQTPTNTLGPANTPVKYLTNGLNRVIDLGLLGYRRRFVAPTGYFPNNLASAAPTANTMYFTRVKAEATGLLSAITLLVNTSSGNLWLAAYDCGDIAFTAGNTVVYTKLWDSGSVACAATGAYQGPYTPSNVPVLEGQDLMLGWMADNNTVRIGLVSTLGASTTSGQLPAGYLPTPGGLLAKLSAKYDVGSFAAPPATLTETDMALNTQIFNILARAN